MGRGKRDKPIIRPNTFRKIVLILTPFAIIWIFYKIISNIGNDPDLEYQPVAFDFQPRSCVVGKDGVCRPLGLVGGPPPAAKGLVAQGDSFYLDGRPTRLLSGSMHYFRIQPTQWGDRLLKMKAAGLNTVTTYIPWNLHEKTRGVYNFGGRWDLSTFIQQVQKVGLHLMVRPGPFICAEWEFGGLPSWLLSDPQMLVRSSKYKPYLQAVERYFSKLLPLIATHGHHRGGPIIAVQLENEFGSFEGRDEEYLRFLHGLYGKYGIEELIFTSDGHKQLQNGTLPDVLATVNFQKDPVLALGKLKAFQPDMPLMIGEYWAGWFDHWGEKHHQMSAQKLEQDLNIILAQNASINLYMFVGGTNFGFWNGANYFENKYLPTVTSYDYDAAIAENGDLTEKFFIVRKVIMKHGLGPVDWTEVPPTLATRKSYGKVDMKACLAMRDLPVLEESQKHNQPLPMERLNMHNGGGQGYGWLLYRHTYTTPAKRLSFRGRVENSALIFVDGNRVGTVPHVGNVSGFDLPVKNGGATVLEILVENMGRVNFQYVTNPKNLLNNERKGILGEVLLDGRPAEGTWEHIPLEFGYNLRQTMHSGAGIQWKDSCSLPAVYRGQITLTEEPRDTYADMSNWGKGIVIVNGFNIGRYWSDQGPQKHLYVPAPLLVRSQNSFIVFELERASTDITLTDKPFLGEPEST